MSHKPIQSDVRETMNQIAKIIDGAVKPYGFVLLVFPFASTNDRMNYISNARREDMIVALKELVARFEGRVPPTTGGA